ncbi:MAG: YtxH domain-containing protein [Vicinamibacteraceae bacterium]
MMDEHRHDVRGPSMYVVFTAGAVLGAGVGMLFAPRPGRESRERIAESVEALRGRASETLQHSQEQVSHVVERGRDAYERTRDVARRSGERLKKGSRGAVADVSEATESL